jgi:hypothetical protein
MIRCFMLMIAHRLLLGLIAVLVLAGPAGAAEAARIDGGSLDARDDRRSGFCLRLTEAGNRYGGGSGSCGRAPWRPRRSNLVTWPAGERLLVAGAVPAGVARGEAELVDGHRIGFDTVAGPGYHGRYAGKLRFFLAALPPADPSDDESGGLLAVRFFGADGTLQGIAESDREAALVGRRRALLRERAHGHSITVSAETRRRVASTPIALDPIEDLTCLLTAQRSPGRCGSPAVAAGGSRRRATASGRASRSRCADRSRSACSASRARSMRTRW